MKSDNHVTLVLVRLGYIFIKVSAGLLIHPYQTMQAVVRKPRLVAATLLPTLSLGGLTIIWRLVITPVVMQFTTCSQLPLGFCESLHFVGNIIIFFCWYWQITLLYLLFRFSRVLKLFA